MAIPELQSAKEQIETPTASNCSDYLRPVPDEGFLKDEIAQPVTVRERLAGWWRGAVDSVLESGRRSDTFWDHMWMERAMAGSIIAGEDPEVAKMRAIQATCSQKRSIKNF